MNVFTPHPTPILQEKDNKHAAGGVKWCEAVV